ncbi:MAG: glycosyltransferase family 4 protein [Planctomycetes bacterium]|nr:glycosyltransferase family 4 protein [Planctomycetota bacterium]MCB9891137.1 glycosyltransferase family 4 protein [Planctomycetota bacterium]MCB9918904.1 glycosyltransferase family 4 protein [Planctomycetota bacterium]
MTDALRILYVVHQFVPRHVAGTELYTEHLARGMQARGHEVAVFATEAYHGEPQSTLREKDLTGLRVFEAVHNNAFADFESSYLDPEKEAQFERVLDAFSPDVVHVQHLCQHSLNDLAIAKRRGLPIVYTLHEFWLLCVHNGWLVRPGYELCAGPEAAACAACAKTCCPAPKAGTGEREWLEAWLARDATVRAALEHVDLFVSPSHFLRERFVEAGLIAAEKIIASDNGSPPHTLRRGPHRESDHLRIGFLGTLAEWKGIHVLIEAMNRLGDDEASLELHGVLEYFPQYVERLRDLARHPRISFEGRYDNAHVADILAGIDVLVVPSLWYENSPITIHEAFSSGVPVVASGVGGMAEFVEHEKNGLHFQIGSSDSLFAALRRLIDEEGLLQRLRSGMPVFKTIEHDCADQEARYRALLSPR